ncbi:FISUMP domain-containing protein [Fibrobacter sp. UWH4]|uniref:FISUMP domain-containing protein n=1 Tax=Fibrobacter sp. UWH4 TaxID=1896210 RepID=UPI001114A21B|nr:FISUMP domain-containing protein [Fibrobacter sp. UWH4]
MKIFTLRHSWPVILEAKRRESILLAMALVFAVFTACDSGSSSTDPDPIAEVSSSSDDIRQCEEQSDDCDDTSSSSGEVSKNSSSSQKIADKDKSSSSIEEKSSSSVSGKNSSSSVAESSSSDSVKTCTPDQEGLEQWYFFTKETYVCQNGVWVLQSSSSVVEESSSSKYYDMSRQFNAKLSYGEFTDPRDNHVYKTIRLYDDVTDTLTFFAENLNFGKMISGGNQQGDSTKYCYDDDPWYCENGWGGLYTWATAMAFPAVCDSSQMGSDKCPNTTDESRNTLVPNNSEYVVHRGICPEGWHIMNRGEWVAAINGHGAMNGSQYLSSEVWNGIMKNPRGFSLLPAGLYDEYGEFSQIMKQAFHWVPGESFDEKANLYKGLFVRATDLDLQRDSKNRFIKTAAFSIRCVKDY